MVPALLCKQRRRKGDGRGGTVFERPVNSIATGRGHIMPTTLLLPHPP